MQCVIRSLCWRRHFSYKWLLVYLSLVLISFRTFLIQDDKARVQTSKRPDTAVARGGIKSHYNHTFQPSPLIETAKSTSLSKLEKYSQPTKSPETQLQGENNAGVYSYDHNAEDSEEEFADFDGRIINSEEYTINDNLRASILRPSSTDRKVTDKMGGKTRISLTESSNDAEAIVPTIPTDSIITFQSINANSISNAKIYQNQNLQNDDNNNLIITKSTTTGSRLTFHREKFTNGVLRTVSENNLSDHHGRNLPNSPNSHVTMKNKQTLVLTPCPRNILNISQSVIDQSRSLVHTYPSFSHAVKTRAVNKMLILVIVQNGYVDMAKNFYITSLLRFNLMNYLFVCLDEISQESLKVAGHPCFFDREEYKLKQKTAFNMAKLSISTKNITLGDTSSIKTHFVLRVLRLGYRVIVVDPDIVLLQNPVQKLKCKPCDMFIHPGDRWIRTREFNSGFYFVKPTMASISLYKRALALAQRKPGLSSNEALATVLAGMLKKDSINIDRSLYATTKSSAKLDGIDCYIHNRIFLDVDAQLKRMFPNFCRDCDVFQTHAIRLALTHKLKEGRYWFIDYGSYYSSQKTRYLEYGNPLDFGFRKTPDMEMQALRNALLLSQILGRVLVLPVFHCNECVSNNLCIQNNCSMPNFLKVSELEKYFSGAYREQMFFCHPWVPEKYKSFNRVLISIVNQFGNGTQAVDKTFTPRDIIGGPTKKETEDWFINSSFLSNQIILKVDNLYGRFKNFYAEPAYALLAQRLKQATNEN